MKLHRLVVIILLSCLSHVTDGQQKFFVYLQTENGQAFYVKNGSQIMSSSGAGYLIIPHLPSGKYDFHVGFPKDEGPEESFGIDISKNAGFLIKKFGDRGYGLFDLQTLSLVMAKAKPEEERPKEIQTDPFSSMLAKVVQDSSILEKQAPLPEIISENTPGDLPPDSSVSVFIGPDTSSLVSTISSPSQLDQSQDPVHVEVDSSENQVTPDIEQDQRNALEMDTTSSVLLQSQLASQHIRRTLRIRTMEGLEMAYIDSSASGVDIVRLFMPVSTPGITVEPERSDSENSPQEQVPGEYTNQNTENLDVDSSSNLQRIVPDETSVNGPDTTAMGPPATPRSQIVDSESNPRDTKTTPDISPVDANEYVEEPNDANTVLPKVVESSSINSDCRDFADHEDFMKLRKKMAAENSKDKMLKVARKILETRCFSTEQIKNLSFLFLTDQGKYEFFDAAYPFTSDSNEYLILESQLSDPYYVNRFKAMINK